MTERSEIFEILARLQLSGMRAIYDEMVTMSTKRQHGVERVIHALLKAEIAAKQARSINYQQGVAKLPLVKELAEHSFEGTPINRELTAQLASGDFLNVKRNIVLIGGPARARVTLPWASPGASSGPAKRRASSTPSTLPTCSRSRRSLTARAVRPTG